MRIPSEDNPQISMNVPGVNAPAPYQFGKSGQALEALGMELEQQSLGLHNQLVHLQALSTSADAFSRTRIASVDKMAELKLRHPDGFIHEEEGNNNSPYELNDDGTPKTIVRAYHEWADEHYKEMQDSMPSGIASQMYREKALPHITDDINRLQLESKQMLLDSDHVRWNGILDRYGGRLTSNPRLGEYHDMLDDITTEMQSRVGISHSSVEAQEKLRDSYKKLGRDLMQGVYTDVLDEKKHGALSRVQQIYQWRADLAGHPIVERNAKGEILAIHNPSPDVAFRKANGMPTLSDTMDPVQKSVEEEKLIRLLPNARNSDGKDLSEYIRNLSVKLSNGAASRDEVHNVISKIQGRVREDPERYGAWATDVMAGLAAQDSYGSRLGGNEPAFNARSPKDRAQVENDEPKRVEALAEAFGRKYGVQDPKLLGAMAADKLKSTLHSANLQIEARKNKDYAAFSQETLTDRRGIGIGSRVAAINFSDPTGLSVARNIPVLEEYSKLHDSLMEMNPPSDPLKRRAPISEEQGKALASTIMAPHGQNSVGGGLAAKAVQGYAQWSRFPEVLRQIIKDGNLEPNAELLLNHARSGDTQALTSTIEILRGGKVTRELFEKQFPSDFKGREEKLRVASRAKWGGHVDAQMRLYPESADREHLMNSEVETGVTAGMKQMLSSDVNEEEAIRRGYNNLLGKHLISKSFVSTGGKTSYLEMPSGVGEQGLDNSVSNLKEFMRVENFMKMNPTHAVTPDGKLSRLDDKFPRFIENNLTASYDPVLRGAIFNYQDRDGNFYRLMTTDRHGTPRNIVLPLSELLKPPAPSWFDKTMKYLDTHWKTFGGPAPW
jgi:hypothetical protein